MTPGEFDTALQAAFDRCSTAGCPLTDTQRQILLQVAAEFILSQAEVPELGSSQSNSVPSDDNPLDELTAEQRQVFLQFVKQHELQDLSWKTQLLNDWLHDRHSGTMQFLREQYGPLWLNRVKAVHFNKYASIEAEEALKIKVGDRLEVSNGLWEWVQETGPCSREWISCIVVSVKETSGSNGAATSCIIRFDSGVEYEIQGIYSWNRFNWRWAEE